MNFAPALQTAAIVALATSAAFAQSITIDAVAQTALSALAHDGSSWQTQAGVPIGTDVSNGITLNAHQGGSSSHLRFNANGATTNQLSFGLMTFATTNGSQLGQAAGSGRSEVLVAVTLDQPMTLDVTFSGTVIACTGAVIGTAEIDIGNDGSVELHVVPDQNLSGHGHIQLKLPMPAGRTEILLAVDLELPPSTNSIGRLNEVRAEVMIRPGHAKVTAEGSHCGLNLNYQPRLDGRNVDFWIYGAQGDLPFLVIGADRELNRMPVAPSCWLLVSPDIIIPTTVGSHQPVPVGLLPAGTEVFVQGGALRPEPLWFSASGLFLTPRFVVEVL